MQNAKLQFKIKNSVLKKAVEFHGHLGPYLVLGLLMGEACVRKLKCRRHFGIAATIKGAITRPQSCLIDGIQLSTGCTYGKGNIRKLKGKRIEAVFLNTKNNKRIRVLLNKCLLDKLSGLKGHKDSEKLARELYGASPEKIFNFTSS